MTSVTIPNSVTEIGEYAFKGCSNLKLVINLSNLTFSEGSSNYGYIAYYADKIRNYPNGLIVDDFVFSKAPNGYTLVKYLGNANQLTLPTDVNGENYIIGKSAFSGCSDLTSVTIGNSVTSIGDRAFSGCSGLTSVTIGNSVTSIGDRAFDDCSSLTSVTIGNSVTSIGDRAFYDCSNIRSKTNNINSNKKRRESSIQSNVFSKKTKKTIWLTNTPPKGYENAAGDVNYAANNQYSSLPNVKIYPYLSSIFEVDGVKYVPVSPSERTCDAIDCAYYSTETNINIDNTVSYKGVAMTVKNINPYTCYGNNFIKSCTININGNIGEYAFCSCKNLESLNLSANKIGNNAFYGCSAIENAIINTTTIGVSAFEYSATKNPAIVFIEASSIAESAFSKCSAIKTIFLENKLKTIGNLAFYECKNLNAIAIPNSVTSLGESAFYNCSSLKNITIGDAVEKINSSTFYNCSSLKNITIGDGAKSIGNNAFHGCSSLFAIEIPKNVTSIGNSAFENCSNLSEVIIKDRTTVLTLGSNKSKPLFSDCPLDSVYIGGDISYKKTSDYGYSPFYNNKTLRAVTISNKETEISENEFYGCANLKSVSIGDGIMSIGNYAFSGCSSLKSFAFGSRLKTIGKEAFSDCTALTKLSSKAIIPPVCGQQALDDINKWECELYVPDNAVSAYKGANQWKEFFFINPNK